jgi:ABC-type nitrate/sulfonate/bicarbonate transport system ATPase subunit
VPTVASSYEAFLNAVFVLVAVQDLVLSEVETLAVLGAGGFGKVTLVRYKGERRGATACKAVSEFGYQELP